MAKGGAPVLASSGEKRKPQVRVGSSDYEKKIPMKGMKSLKLGDHVCVIILGTVKSLQQSEYDTSFSVEMDECEVSKHSKNADLEDIIKSYGY